MKAGPLAVHENVAPATLEVNGILIGVPEQIVFVRGVVVRSGVGLTVTT